MPRQKRFKTKYPGVYYILADAVGSAKTEKIYYVMYRKDGKQIEEKAGRQYQDDMTPARAATLRASRIEGGKSNQERREEERAKAAAEAGKWTLNRLWEEYKRQRPGLKGLRTDENRYSNHLSPAFGHREPRELAPLDVDRVRIKLSKSHAPATVRNVLELLRRLVNFGVNKNLCQGLCFKIEMPRLNNLKTEDLTPGQLQALLTAIEEDSNLQVANLMKMALYTGMRRGELFRLRWEDIDYERGFIHIRDPKGGQDQRIPLNDAARGLLDLHPKISGSPYVFPGRGGKQRQDCIKQVNKIKERAGLPKDFRAMHGLRHVYASILASSGQVDLYTLQKLLTHKSPSMTQRYAHLRDDALKVAANVISESLGQQANQSFKSQRRR